MFARVFVVSGGSPIVHDNPPHIDIHDFKMPKSILTWTFSNVHSLISYGEPFFCLCSSSKYFLYNISKNEMKYCGS